MLHLCLGLSSVAHARLRRVDLDAVRAAPGVALVLTAADIPGVNDISPTHRHDEPILAEDIVEYAGQPIFRSEEHTSELQSLMRISYAVFCLKKKNNKKSKQ